MKIQGKDGQEFDTNNFGDIQGELMEKLEDLKNFATKYKIQILTLYKTEDCKVGGLFNWTPSKCINDFNEMFIENDLRYYIVDMNEFDFLDFDDNEKEI